MLVLTRKMQERIQIGSNITITILRVKGNSVRVGIDAPREVRVVRGELTIKGDDSSDSVDESLPVLAQEFDVSSDEAGTVDGSAADEPASRSATDPQAIAVPV